MSDLDKKTLCYVKQQQLGTESLVPVSMPSRSAYPRKRAEPVSSSP